jgi:glycosyltransferase involved in cell wall biosynthesis
METPLVSIVTPCLNAERYIARTVESVLAQDYSRIEYIVMDGGSRDETLPILERFGSRLRYISEADGGAADAINRGYLRSRGCIFAWLNADDIYLPGAVRTAVNALMSQPEAAVVYGEGLWIGEHGTALGPYPTVSPYNPALLERECFICQPSSFMRREAFEAVGMLDPALQCAFDYELWMRLSRRHQFAAIPDVLAASRMHKANKSLKLRRVVFQENMRALRKHFGYVPVNWIYGYLSFLRDGRDQFFEPLHNSVLVYLASLFIGSYWNRTRMFRYWRDWSSPISARLLR